MNSILIRKIIMIGVVIAAMLITAFMIMVAGADSAQAYSDELYQCRKITDWYYECWTKRNFNWWEERLGFRDFWYWKRV